MAVIKDRKQPTDTVLEERNNFKILLAKNPNYFGNLAKSSLTPVKKLVADTTFEELTCVGFNPETNFLEATIAVKRPAGYGGDLCQAGTTEYVRFFLDYGQGWVDVGITGVSVHDIPNEQDCAEEPNKPLIYVATLKLDPKTACCNEPVLPKVHAILSWNWTPPAGPANVGWLPPWGNAFDCAIQIRPHPWNLFCLFELIGASIPQKIKIPPLFEQVQFQPIPQPDPGPYKLAELAKLYALKGATKAAGAFNVEPHRFGLTDIHAAIHSGTSSEETISSKMAEYESLGIDWNATISAFQETDADVSYEQIECLGLDNNLERLVATFRIKRSIGYAGDLCVKGSQEYVAFWADWDNTCEWTYLGTVPVNVHDIAKLPNGGLCYSAILPVNLLHYRRSCKKPKIARVRAVLSWAVPPSTWNPDALNTWGNRLDTHVQIKPGPEIPPGQVIPLIWKLGGINVEDIDNTATGLTKTTAQFDNGFGPDPLHVSLPDPNARPCPFGGRVVVKGYPFPGFSYRVQVKRQTDATWNTVATKLHLEPLPGFGLPYDKTDLGGYFTYETVGHNPDMILAWWDTVGDELWEVKLDIQGVAGADTHLIQLDNTAPTPNPPLNPPTVDIHLDSGGDCKDFIVGDKLKGHFVARDKNFAHYSLAVSPFSTPPGVLTPAGGSQQTGSVAGDDQWTLDTTGMRPCGYVVTVGVVDLAIVDSSYGDHHSNYASVGFCLRAQT